MVYISILRKIKNNIFYYYSIKKERELEYIRVPEKWKNLDEECKRMKKEKIENNIQMSGRFARKFCKKNKI